MLFRIQIHSIIGNYKTKAMEKIENEKRISKRKKSLKYVDNVIQLRYTGVFTKNDLKEISEHL
jgi:hypothetical protein